MRINEEDTGGVGGMFVSMTTREAWGLVQSLINQLRSGDPNSQRGEFDLPGGEFITFAVVPPKEVTSD
jgi:hypothetical protein